MKPKSRRSVLVRHVRLLKKVRAILLSSLSSLFSVPSVGIGCVVDASGGALRYVLHDEDVELREGGVAVLTEGAAAAIERAIVSC